MKTIRSLLLLLAMSVSVSAFAQYIEGTTPLLAPVAPASALDTYASHTEEYGQGGFRSVADATARDAIPADRMKVGMLVHCLDTGTIFRLSASSNWVDSGIKAAGDWVATNLLAVASAEAGRTALALGTQVTNTTADGWRSTLGLGEFTTNSVPLKTGNHSTEAALDVDEVLGDAGVRFKYGTNEYMLMLYGTNLNLVSALDGSIPSYVASPGEAALLTYKSLTNLFVLKTNDYGVLPLLASDPVEIATNTYSRIYTKVGQKSRATLFGQVLEPVGVTNLASEVVMVGPDAVATVDTIILGSTNIIEGIAGKQPYDAQLDQWATVGTNSVTALGVGTLVATDIAIGATNVVAAISGKQATNVVATYADLEAFTGPATVIAVANTSYGGLFTYTTNNPIVSEIANMSGGSGYTMTPTVFEVVAGGTGYTNGPATITIDSTAVDVSIVTAAGVITSVVPAGAGTLAAPTTDSWTICSITQGAGADGTARASTWTPLTRNISGGTAVTPAVVTITRIRSGYPDIAFVSSSGEYTVLPGTEDTSKLYHTASLEVSGSEVSPTFRVYSAGRYGTWIPATGKGSGKWVRQNVSQIDVSFFGAVSDTTTDNTKALNAACVAARTFRLGLLFNGPGAVNASNLPTKGYLVSNRIDARQIYQLKMDAPIVVNANTFNSTNIVLHVGGDTNDCNPYNLENIWIAGNTNVKGTDITNVAGLYVNQMMYSQVSVRQISRVGAGIRFEMTHRGNIIVANTWRIGNLCYCGNDLHVTGRSSIPLGGGWYNEQVFIGGYWRAALWSTGYGTANIRLDRGLGASKFYGCIFETDCPLVLGHAQLLTFSDIRIEKEAPHKIYYSIDPTTPYTGDRWDTQYPALIINPNTFGNRNRLTWDVRENERGVVWLGEDSAEEASHSPTRLFQFPGPVKSSANNYLMFPGLIAWDLATKTRIDGDAIIESADETKPQGLRKWQMKSPSTAMSGKMFGMRFSHSNLGKLVLRVEGYDHGLYAQNLSANTHDAEFFAPRMAKHTAGTSLYYTFQAGGGDVFIPQSWKTFIIGIGDPGVASSADNTDGSTAPTIRVVVGDAIPIDDILISRPVVRELPDKGIVPPNAEYLSYANGDVFRAGPWISTTLAAQAVGGATTLTVASTDGLCAGDSFHLESDYEYEYETWVRLGSIGKIATVVDGTTLTVTPALATGTYPIGYGFKAQRWTTTKTIGQTSVADMLATVDPSKVSLNVGSHDSNDGMAGLYAPREVHTYDTSATNGWTGLKVAAYMTVGINGDGDLLITRTGATSSSIGVYKDGGAATIGQRYVMTFTAKSDGNALCDLVTSATHMGDITWLTGVTTTSTFADYAVAFTALTSNAFRVARTAENSGDWLVVKDVVVYPYDLWFAIKSNSAKASTVDTDYYWEQLIGQPVSLSQAITAVGNTVLCNGDVLVLDPDGDYTMTSTPTITAGTVAGQRITLICGPTEANTVTLQDESVLTGSTLQLKAPTRTILPNVTSTLVWDGFNWIETETSDANTMYFASVNIGATNVVAAISGKQDADAQLDEWASVSTNSVTALGVGALTGTTVIAPNIIAVVADIAALEAHDSATTTTIVVKDVNRGGTFVATTIDAETYIPTMASLAITDGGAAYPAAPFWRTVSGGTGTAATVYVTEVTDGAITAARIANPGIYTAYPGTRTGAGTYTVTLTDGGVETSVATLTLTTASGVAVESTTDGTVWVRQYVGPIEDRWFAGTASTALRSALFTAAGGVGELLVGLRATDYDLGEIGPVDSNNVLQLGYASLNGLVIEGRGARLYSSDNLNARGMINLSDRSSGNASGVVTAGVTFRDMTIDSIQKTVGDPNNRIGVEWCGDTDGLLDPHLIAFESVTFTNCVRHHIYASGRAREVIFDGCTIYGEADGGHDEPNKPICLACKDSNVTIRGCTFLNDAENKMVYAGAYKTISVTDNVVENVRDFVEFRMGNFLVAGNRITGGVNSLAGTMIMAFSTEALIVRRNAVITDNVFVDCDSKNIIYLNGITNVVVSDNIVKNTSATAYYNQYFVRCYDDVSDLYIDGNIYEGSPNSTSGNMFLYCYTDGTTTPLLRGVIGSNVMRNKMVFVNLEDTIQSKPFIYVTGQNFLDDTYGTTHLPIKDGSKYYTSHPNIVFGPGGGLTWTGSIGGTTYITGWAATLTTPSASIIRGAVGSTISDWQGRQWWSVSAVSNVVTTGGTNWVLRDLTTHTFHKMDYAETPTLLTDQASFFIADDPGSVTRMHVIDENSKTGPVDFGWRSTVTVQRTSLAGATKIVDESGDAIGNFDTGWTVGASWTTNSIAAEVNATGATNSLSHTTVTPLVGPPRYVTMTLVSSGAWTVDATASLTVTVGGSLMRTFTNADPPSGTMTISGMVDGTTDEVVFTVYAPTGTTVSGSFDNFKIEVLAAGDFLHRHTYPAAALVKATSATAPAPYFEFSAAGTHAANGNAKDKVIALVNTTVTSAPAILATIASTDNAGSWRLKGKLYAAYGSGGTDYDNFMLELDYVDGSGTYVTSLHSTDLTGDVFAWNAAGYFLIGANADTADGDVTINTSSVEYKP